MNDISLIEQNTELFIWEKSEKLGKKLGNWQGKLGNVIEKNEKHCEKKNGTNLNCFCENKRVNNDNNKH